MYFVQEEPCSLPEQKKRIRASMKKRRSENENKDVKERRMVDIFFQQGFGEYSTYFIYRSYSSEARTDLLIERLLSLGKEVYCPRVEGTEMVAVLSKEGYKLSEKGIREPLGERFDGKFDLTVLPLLAVDRKGNRLGYGGGYYDRFIKAHDCGFLLGYGYSFQRIERVPTEESDEKIDGFLCEEGYFAKEKE